MRERSLGQLGYYFHLLNKVKKILKYNFFIYQKDYIVSILMFNLI